MKVIFIKDVVDDKTGRIIAKSGDVKEVSGGYARNFLFSKNQAIPANAENFGKLTGQKESEAFKLAEKKSAAEAISAKLSGKSLELFAKSGGSGKLFGAITGKEISALIKTELGVDVDKKQLVLGEPIKAFGSFKIKAKIFTGVTAEFMVCVKEKN